MSMGADLDYIIVINEPALFMPVVKQQVCCFKNCCVAGPIGQPHTFLSVHTIKQDWRFVHDMLYKHPAFQQWQDTYAFKGPASLQHILWRYLCNEQQGVDRLLAPVLVETAWKRLQSCLVSRHQQFWPKFFSECHSGHASSLRVSRSSWSPARHLHSKFC